MENNGKNITAENASFSNIQKPEFKFLHDEIYFQRMKLYNKIPKLDQEGNFSEAGKRFFEIEALLSKLEKLPVRIYTGHCTCEKRIWRQDVLDYCAYCHKLIKPLSQILPE